MRNLRLDIFRTKLKYFSNKLCLIVHWRGKKICYTYYISKKVFHSFIWIFNALNIENEAANIEFFEKTINAQLPDHLNDQSFLSQLRLNKFMLTLELTGSTTRMNVASPMVNILLRRQLLQNLLILNLAMMKSKRF